MANSNLITINDSNYTQYVDYSGDDGIVRAKGLNPTRYNYYAKCVSAFTLDLIPESEWDRLIAEQETNRSSLQHIRDTGDNGKQIPSYDQNGKGYCWMHSGTSAVTMVRAVNNQPYVPLSAYAGACIIKNYRDEGGNGIDGLQFIADRGIPSSQYWPMQSMSRANDNPATWTNAAKHKCTEWLECSSDPKLRRLQVGTALLLNLPVIGDYNWWSHSVCPIRLMSKTKVRILNSWGDSWSDHGVGDLDQSKAWPDEAWVALVESASRT